MFSSDWACPESECMQQPVIAEATHSQLVPPQLKTPETSPQWRCEVVWPHSTDLVLDQVEGVQVGEVGEMGNVANRVEGQVE